jgi:hypothetical protein
MFPSSRLVRCWFAKSVFVSWWFVRGVFVSWRFVRGVFFSNFLARNLWSGWRWLEGRQSRGGYHILEAGRITLPTLPFLITYNKK